VESRVERFEQIRRDRDREGLSIRGLARRHGVHRRAVREALLSPVSPAKRAAVGRPAPRLGAYRAVIDSLLEADRVAPRKQWHTVKRIHQRLVDELGGDVAETTVRQYVRARKRAMGWAVCEVFVAQIHAPGMEGEVGWGEADVVLAGVVMTVHLFVMRASFSGAAFCQASLVETPQAFLELHVQAFEWFGGVFPSLRFEYVPRHIFELMCPTRLCGRQQRGARNYLDCGRQLAVVGHITLTA
jgi:transposase